MILFGIHPRPCGAAAPMDVVLCYESIDSLYYSILYGYVAVWTLGKFLFRF